jgi:hypothetical protein
MGKGGGGGPSQQTVTQTNLPEYARPYFENLLQRGQAESYREYTPYEGQRLAGFTPEQTGIQQEVLGMQTPGQFGGATGFTAAAGLGSLAAGQYDPGQFYAQRVRGPQLQQFQAQGPEGVQSGMASFTGEGTAERFMSPYQQAVTDVQKQAAVREAQLAQQQTNLGAARQGTYGGARQALAQAERERGLLDRLSQIQAQGSQSAFDAAQRAFEAEQGRGLQAGLQTQQLGTQTGLENLRAQLGVQQLGAQTSLEAQRANQQAMLEAQRLGEQSRQFGGSLGLQGLAQLGQMGGQLANIGTAEQAADFQRLQAQEATAAQQRALEQQRMDMAYSDFLRQRDYPMEQLSYYSSLLRGLPMQLSSAQTAYQAPPSFAQQATGLGLGALGLYNLSR